MKKGIALLLAVCMMLVLGACASEKKSGEAASPYGLVEEGKLLVAMSPDFSPMEFVDTSKSGQEQYVGFDVMLAQYLAQEMGLEMVIKPMSFEACQTAVQMKSVDLAISGFSYMEERAENFSLSDYYYAGDNETQHTIIVSADKAGTFSKAEDFQGMTIGAQAASLQENLCNNQLKDIAQIDLYKAIDDAVLALKTGKIDGVAVAEGNGKAIIANNPDLAISGFYFPIDEAAENNLILLHKEASALTEKVNEILAQAKDAGLYGEWYAKAQELAGISTASEVTYDDQGNKAD